MEFKKRGKEGKIKQVKSHNFMLTSDETDFKSKAVRRDKECHYIMIKGLIQKEVTILNIH